MYKKQTMSLEIKSVQLANFKCFKKEQTFDFNKLTILTGANSSGKSSILHAILGVMQSNEFPFKFSLNGKYVNMGDFIEISNAHKLNNKIKIGVTFEDSDDKSNYAISTEWKYNKSNFLPELTKATIDAGYFVFTIKKSKEYLVDFDYFPDKDPQVREKRQALFENYITTSFQATFELQSISDKTKKLKKKEELSKLKIALERYFRRGTVRNLKISDLDSLEPTIRNKRNMRLLTSVAQINEIISNFERTANIISSYRTNPVRTYLERTKDRLKIDKFGEGYLDQILVWEKKNTDKFTELAKILCDLTLVHSLKANRIKGGRYEVLLSTQKSGTYTPLADVGFGISQFLPIIVADLQLPKESTLLLAEPEIHLHPSVQANFADYIVNSIKEKGKNYIIETHSEYFLNRIRLALVKGDRIQESDISVYYLENNGSDVVAHKIIFTKQGGIKNAPKSFFDTYLMDSKEIAFSVKI